MCRIPDEVCTSTKMSKKLSAGKFTPGVCSLIWPADRQQTLQILGYGEGTAGRYMTPDYVELRRNWTVAQALEQYKARQPK